MGCHCEERSDETISFRNPNTLTTLILPPRLKAEGVLAVHRADRVPAEADMAGDGVGVAPRALHRVFEVQAVAAGRGVQRLDRLHRQLCHVSLVAPAADAVGHR